MDANNYLDSVRKQLNYYRKIAEQAMAQLGDEELHWQYNEESNSIAIIVKHVAGNMRSRFTDFLSADGEKPWRDRDAEFTGDFTSREALMDAWALGWNCLESALDSLQAADLDRIVYIRNEGHTVLEALNRQLAHYSYHVGQIVFIAKMLKNTDWKTLSVARNQSKQFNEGKFAREKGRRHFTDETK